MKFTIALAFLVFPVVIHAETITFFKIQETGSTTPLPFPTNSYTYQAIGVGADGATTYAVDYVWSELVELQRSVFTSDGETRTVVVPIPTTADPLRTVSETLVADATHYHHSVHLEESGGLVEDNIEDCILDGKGRMGCVVTDWRGGQPVVTASFTGSAVPAYTLITNNNQAGGGTKDSSATKPVSHHFVAGGVVILGVLFGFFMGM